MRHRNLCLITLAVGALAACDIDRSVAPVAEPAFLIGSSPLAPLLAEPLEFQLWFWTDAKTGDVTYWATVDVLVNEALFAEPIDPRMRLETDAVYRGGKGHDILASKSTAYLAELDPVASGTKAYGLVVIVMPLTERESSQLGAALTAGSVEVAVSTDLVTTNKDGKDDLLDSLGSLFLADPRPSPTPIPPEWL